MADNTQNTSASNPGIETNTFSKGMFKDYNDTFVGDGLYTHGRNAVNNSHDGNIGVIGNEPSNLKCVTLPYTMIGCIHLLDDQWAIFSTDNTNSEIGIFDESACTYEILTNRNGDPIDFSCLNLKTTNLITGAFRRRYDCERLIYWDDGLNPTRSMDVDTPPCIQSCTTVGGCTTCVDTTALDCEAIRISYLLTHPSITISRGQVSGTLPNGTYQACIAYTINQVRFTDYIGLTNPQGLFTHENTSSSLQITITNIDKSFDEFELVLLTNINSQTVAKRIGFYNTSQGSIYVDRWDTEYVTVNVGDIVFRSEPIEKSDAMYTVNNYLLRIGTYSKFRFNYQPLANKIRANWVSVEYPSDYYVRGGNNTGYMKDEVYAFFIRFVYNTGEFSDSYHIPGRPSTPTDLSPLMGGDAFEGSLPTWQVYNTASATSFPNTSPAYLNGGKIIATGRMGYWESTERYPSNRSDIWNSNPTVPGDPLNLCGQPIRHHKMPDQTVDDRLSNFSIGGGQIRILGVQFENIQPPLDENGNIITSIVGYEILRGSREGNKSIIAKGLLNNMREYDIPENPSVKGLYANYPYNDLGDDKYLTAKEQDGTNGTVDVDNDPLTKVAYDIFTFHSPDTTFSNPYLNPYSLNIYQNLLGNAQGTFQIPYKHPKFKILTTGAFATAVLVAGAISLAQIAASLAGNIPTMGLAASEDIPYTNNFLGSWSGSIAQAGIVPGIIGPDPITLALYGAAVSDAVATVAVLGALNLPTTTEQLVKIIVALVPKRQYAAQYNSHGLYSDWTIRDKGERRRKIEESIYVGSNIQQFTTKYQINNLNRSKVVSLKVTAPLSKPKVKLGFVDDNSRFLISDPRVPRNTVNTPCSSSIGSYYGALKLSIPSQYGQLDSIKQLPITTYDVNGVGITTPKQISRTGVLFGGDIYINRFTEKNSMFFFTNWLMGEPDQIEYDYTKYINIPYPRFWVNNTEKHSFFSLPNDYRVLDQRDSSTFFVKSGWFYLFNSGVRDFFVESEVNVAYRDWEEDVARRHYDPYAFTDLSLMFRSDIIQSGNYYKYDYSLSISKLVGSSISWGNLLPRDYFPETYATCYTYRPNRVIYSLPQQEESKKDNWRMFLPNNYKNFSSPVTSIKQVNKTGALFMMKWQSPLQFMGVEELKLDGTGAKITIGDAGLFTGPQQLQSITNADESYEYGSNQGRFCSLNCVHGVFWVSQNQGKVFQYGGQGINEISNNGMKWWFAKYLPSKLLEIYPDYPYYDNPVEGIGVQMIYDNTHELIYITKRDFLPIGNQRLDGTGKFVAPSPSTGQNIPIGFDNKEYWEEISWTISYDPKTKAWISFHDWIPNFLIPGRSHFMSVAPESGSVVDTIWKHNVRCDSYCNYYGVDYPFEIEFVSATGQQVNSMRSIEYLLEAYNYSNDCRDKFHNYYENFDQAIVYNSEQISGLLELNLHTKNDPLSLLAYPQINPNSIGIQYSKVENKYRFNQFWDITNNRGQNLPSPINIPMFNVAGNGYIYPINPAYVNYSKSPLERKKFRHNVNRVFLRRLVSGSNKFLFKISNQKLLQSPR